MDRNLREDLELLNQVGALTVQEIDRSLGDIREETDLLSALESLDLAQELRGTPVAQGSLVDGSAFRSAEIPVITASPKRRIVGGPRFRGTFSPILRMTDEPEK